MNEIYENENIYYIGRAIFIVTGKMIDTPKLQL